MDPSRKRKVRFVVALTVAVLLAGALVYTSFSASSEARTPSQLMTNAEAGKVYKLTGKVEPGCTFPVSWYTCPGFAEVASCDGERASLEAEKLV